MHRTVISLAISAPLLGFVASAATIGGGGQDDARVAATCAATTVVTGDPAARMGELRLPHDQWYVNADATIWAGWDAPRLQSDNSRNNVVWVRPRGTELTVAARRLDGVSPPIRAMMAADDRWFVVSELLIQDAGCWEVTGTAGSSELTFVAVVHAPPPLPPAISR